MSVYGKIKEYKIVTLQDELTNLTPDDKACESYIKTKHETAEKHGRYIVRIGVSNDDQSINKLQFVTLFLPKTIIDNKLIDKKSYIECSSDSCHVKVIGIDDWFDRAYNGATHIHDIKSKQPYTS